MASSNAAPKDAKKPKPMPKKQLAHFEKRLLDILGYGIELTRESRTGLPIDPAAYYHFSAISEAPSTA